MADKPRQLIPFSMEESGGWDDWRPVQLTDEEYQEAITDPKAPSAPATAEVTLPSVIVESSVSLEASPVSPTDLASGLIVPSVPPSPKLPVLEELVAFTSSDPKSG